MKFVMGIFTKICSEYPILVEIIKITGTCKDLCKSGIELPHIHYKKRGHFSLIED
jgi:hypothetical protein